MQLKYFGDSYDLVKHFWAEKLSTVAPLYAHPRFIPKQLFEDYTRLTSIKILPEEFTGEFGVLLDPHTGIPRPSAKSQKVTLAHASLEFIAEFLHSRNPSYLICFDQSVKREKESKGHEQRQAKCKHLRDNFEIESFYYESHAPFLFAANSRKGIKDIKDRLISIGIPSSRLL